MSLETTCSVARRYLQCDQLVVERYLLHAPNNSMRPVGRRNGAGSLLSVGDCRTAVCSSLYWSLGGLKQSAATKVADWWATMVADC